MSHEGKDESGLSIVSDVWYHPHSPIPARMLPLYVETIL
jgi:hypothetical protein